MNKKQIAMALLTATQLITACQANEKGLDENFTTPIEEAEAPTLKDEEAHELLVTTLQSIKITLDGLGNENGWADKNPVDFGTVKEALRPLVADELMDSYFNDMMTEYYKGTDIDYILLGVLPNIKSTVNQKGNYLQIDTFVPANELYDGTSCSFQLEFDNDAWLLTSWAFAPLTDLKMTKVEAAAYLTYLDLDPVTYLKELHTDEGIAYVFIVGDGQITINSNTSEMTYAVIKKEENDEASESIKVSVD
ncbi:MAG: hypothetical protein ACI35P_07315 [Bacillus sp. (in: firmicutes)]